MKPLRPGKKRNLDRRCWLAMAFVVLCFTGNCQQIAAILTPSATESMAQGVAVKDPGMPPTPSPIPTPALHGYTNVSGGYAFNYPMDWVGTETGTDAHFFVPGDAKAQISVRESLPDETLSSLTDDSGPLPSPPSLVAEVAVGGEPALKQDFLTEQGAISGRAYHVIHSGRVYFFALFSSPEAPVPSSFADALAQFDQLVAGFQFVSP